MTYTGDEYPFDKELRQAALKAFGTSGGISELIALRSRMLQEMNGAILVAYIEKRGGPPPPAEVKRLRQLILAIWNDIASTNYLTDPPDEEQHRGTVTACNG